MPHNGRAPSKRAVTRDAQENSTGDNTQQKFGLPVKLYLGFIAT